MWSSSRLTFLNLIRCSEQNRSEIKYKLPYNSREPPSGSYTNTTETPKSAVSLNAHTLFLEYSPRLPDSLPRYPPAQLRALLEEMGDLRPTLPKRRDLPLQIGPLM